MDSEARGLRGNVDESIHQKPIAKFNTENHQYFGMLDYGELGMGTQHIMCKYWKLQSNTKKGKEAWERLKEQRASMNSANPTSRSSWLRIRVLKRRYQASIRSSVVSLSSSADRLVIDSGENSSLSSSEHQREIERTTQETISDNEFYQHFDQYFDSGKLSLLRCYL